MLDRWTLTAVKPLLKRSARMLDQMGLSPNQVTLTGFMIGMTALPLLAFEHYSWALLAIVLNRLADGIDGELARLQGATDAGAYLDIALDFVFYATVVAGFALAAPETNALAAAFLLLGFMGTGSSFLAFAIMAERRGFEKMNYPSKGFYYLEGITEGTETIAFLVLMCLFPGAFAALAWGFFALCALTTLTRVVGGYHTLSQRE